MELCSDNLKNVIQQKREFFRRKISEPMKPMEYFISCQLFQEMLECVQYLHESNPPIIHGNLKPENILICENSNLKRFVKLGDFGLVQPDVPNVATRLKPDNKLALETDIYTIRGISIELFDFNTLE